MLNRFRSIAALLAVITISTVSSNAGAQPTVRPETVRQPTVVSGVPRAANADAVNKEAEFVAFEKSLKDAKFNAALSVGDARTAKTIMVANGSSPSVPLDITREERVAYPPIAMSTTFVPGCRCVRWSAGFYYTNGTFVYHVQCAEIAYTECQMNRTFPAPHPGRAG